MKAPTLTYRIEAIDAGGATVHEIPAEIGTLDGVLVFQIADDYCLSEAENARVSAALKEAFPGRRVLLLSNGIRFVRFVPVEDKR